MNLELSLNMTERRPIFSTKQVFTARQLRLENEYLLHYGVLKQEEKAIILTDSIVKIYPIFVLLTDMGNALFVQDENGRSRPLALREIGLEPFGRFWTNRSWVEDPAK